VTRQKDEEIESNRLNYSVQDKRRAEEISSLQQALEASKDELDQAQ